jgi:membrane-associated protease RseP (regulator of RpoE activity)
MLTLILTVCLFTALGMLIHELGHLFAARCCKVPASELAIGLGPKLFGFSLGSIRFNVRALPLGSFVRLDGTVLKSSSVGAQLFVHLGGIAFNLIAGFAAFGTMFGWFNLLVAAGNILPIYQHDGWKCGLVLMRAYLQRRSQRVEWAFTFSGGFISLLIGWVVLRMFV